MTDEEKREVWVKVQDNVIHKVYVCTEHPYGVLVEDWVSGIPLHYNVPYCNILTAKAPDEQVRELQAENAALRERLENAVELKAKVGDVIYMPWEYDGSNGVATLSIIGSDFHNDEFIYITDLESDSVYYLEKYKNGIFCDKDFDNIVFTDRSKAYARLAELKGEKE